MTLFELIQVSPWVNAIKLGGVPVLNQLIAKNNIPIRPIPVIPGETWEALWARCGTVQVRFRPRTYFGNIAVAWTAQVQVQKAERREMPKLRGHCYQEKAATRELLKGLPLPATLKPVAEWTEQEYDLFTKLFTLELVKREKAQKLSIAGISRMVSRIKSRISPVIQRDSLRGYKIHHGVPSFLMNAMLIKAYRNDKEGRIGNWFARFGGQVTFSPGAPFVISKIMGLKSLEMWQNNKILPTAAGLF